MGDTFFALQHAARRLQPLRQYSCSLVHDRGLQRRQLRGNKRNGMLHEGLDLEDRHPPQNFDTCSDFGSGHSERNDLEGRHHVACPHRHMVCKAGKGDRRIEIVDPIDRYAICNEQAIDGAMDIHPSCRRL